MSWKIRKGTRNNVNDWRFYHNGIIRFRIRRLGLGDLVEKFTIATGIKYLVKKIYGEKDCGCQRRKEKLNKIKLWKTKSHMRNGVEL